MKIVRSLNDALRGLVRFALLPLLLLPFAAGAALEQTFDMLQVGTATYQKVTVTTKNRNYVFILHSKGMTNIKVADLSSDLRAKLGYEDAASAQVKSNSPSVWARQTLSKLEAPQVKQIRERVFGWCQPTQLSAQYRLPELSQKSLLICAAALLGLFLFHSYCCLLICTKSGAEPGPLVWVPVLQLFPLLKAAGMSPWWFLGFLIPGLNLLAQILWFIKITQARGKGFGVALLLIFPLTNPFAAMYLAFSGSPSARKETRRVEIMTLETA